MVAASSTIDGGGGGDINGGDDGDIHGGDGDSDFNTS